LTKITQDEQGKVHVHEPGRGGLGGAVAGKYLDRPIRKGNPKGIGEALTPGSPAVLLLLKDTYTEDVVTSMSGYNANVVTLALGGDISDSWRSFPGPVDFALHLSSDEPFGGVVVLF
jgi:hypothetical protein